MQEEFSWRDQGRLLDILTHSEKVLFYVKDKSLDELEEDESLQLILRSLFTIIGEAASKLSDDVTKSRKDIPWGKIAGLRHRIVHDYDKINWERIWEIIGDDLPPLIEKLGKIVPPEQ
jgi:uncharacterized protein with HEPN domain